jgi:hypothetical protein
MIRTKAFSLSHVTVGLLLALTIAGCHGDDDDDHDIEVTVANLNILHGFACDAPAPADGDQCRVADRIDLLIQHITAADCPDIVTLQEHVTAEFLELDPGVLVGPLANTVALTEERLPAYKRPVASLTTSSSIPKALRLPLPRWGGASMRS